jgi:hypothetical protein
MKKSFLLLPIVGAFAYLTLCSDSGGKSGNLTTSGCGSCHGNSPTSGIQLAFSLDSAGTPVTKYKGGMAYTLKLVATNTTSNSLRCFGYQMTAKMGTGVQAGTFGTLPSGTNTHTSGGLTVLGHTRRISHATGTGAAGTTYMVAVPWTAPAAGSGTVTVNAVLNAVDSNLNDGSSDHWNTGAGTFAEWAAAPSSVSGVANSLAVTAFPNPVAATLTLDFGTNAAGTYSIAVFNLNGQLVATATTEANTLAMNTSNWATGMYSVSITNGGAVKTINVVKQ